MTEIREGKPFPNLSMTDRTGKTVNRSDLKGTWLLLFAAPKNSLETLPNLKELAQLLRSEEAVLAGVVDDSFPSIEGCVMLIQNKDVSETLPGDRFSLFLIDPNGMLRLRFDDTFEPPEVLSSIRNLKLKWLSAW